MRRHLYLVVENENDESLEGGVTVTEGRYVRAEKNVQTVHDKRNVETNETWQETVVSLGYYDFEDEEEYEDLAVDVMRKKLGEVDERHLEDAGLDPEEVLG